ncbi:MAG: PEGA domain-containing protein [Patescibacteria group bacterium]|nr:PEGA domain-containing protein [Patescibacteria group bacterium]
MKKKIVYVLFLVTGFGIFILLKDVIFKREADMGRLRIHSSPSAGVFIDSTAVGKTPFEDKLKAGEYTVKLIPEGMASNIVSWQGKVRVTQHALTYVNRELGSSEVSSGGEIMTMQRVEGKMKSGNHGQVYVETDPPGAIVYFDNDEKGVAPIALNDILSGNHEVSVYLPGFFRRTQKINVDGGYRTSISFSLVVDSTKKDVNQLLKEKQAQREKEKKEATESAELDTSGAEDNSPKVTIQNTPTGFLRVRSEPTVNSIEIAKVSPNETYVLVEETDGWFKIRLESGSEGWISSDYAVKQEKSDN